MSGICLAMYTVVIIIVVIVGSVMGTHNSYY